MIRKIVPVLVIVSFASFGYTQTDTVNLKNKSDSLSYVIGRDVGQQLKSFGANLSMDPFMAGMEGALKDDSSKISAAKADSIRQKFSMEVQQRLQAEFQEKSTANKKDGEAFLAQNKKKSGVKVTSSGLQYRVIKAGKGKKAEVVDSVKVIYKGMLLDSTVFDSTASNQPVFLNLQRVIPGLVEGIKLMNEGASYRFFIPSGLAYGEQGAPPVIPPNAVLIFDIQLMEVPRASSPK